ncbi:hypothetical protein MVEN_00098800 [Mycena venus]|uniref:Uncharacterized protein n=1 Tax=Mycena venus TaxID=2733690 RepID=A0A8H7DEE3_9AGAR|nr:hypothetical protein MVEN_00098800 [Mycena venus]
MAITIATSASTAANSTSAIKGETAPPASAPISPSNDIKPEALVEGIKTESVTIAPAPTTGANPNASGVAQPQPPKRPAAHRANVERIHRETLNGRFFVW